MKSVCVWAFDSDGRLVWSDNVSGPQLSTGDFYIDTPLTEGKYDFVSWCGLEGNSDFSLATYTPSSKEELEVKLNTLAENGENVSKSHIPGLYHGYVSNVEYKVDPFARLHLVGESIGKLDVVIVDKPHAELRGASLRSVGHHRAAGSHHGEQ